MVFSLRESVTGKPATTQRTYLFVLYVYVCVIQSILLIKALATTTSKSETVFKVYQIYDVWEEKKCFFFLLLCLLEGKLIR